MGENITNLHSSSNNDSDHEIETFDEYDKNKTPLKKIKRVHSKEKGGYKFNNAWLEDEAFKNWILQIKDDAHNIRCRICNVQFTIKYRGASALKTHMQSERHIKQMQSYNSSTVLSNFMFNTNYTNDEEIISELILTYHAVKHHHSYLSQDCGNKLYKKVFADSKTAGKIKCGRTKAESLVELVLAPYSLQLILNLVKNYPYAICTDASNKGNKKMFPIAIKFFDEERGSIYAILDFYEDANESSNAIANRILECINKTGLDQNKLVSYGADNASVNFGKNNSVYIHLKNKLNLPSLIAGHCNAHILHNTVKYGLQLLSYDVENLVLKVYATFSSSAKEVESLKEFCKFIECEYSTILRHVPTRFLSLYSAVDKLLMNWEPLKCYFISKGKEKVNKGIWTFLKQNEHGVNNQISLAELYIYFVHNIMHYFQNVIKIVESNYLQPPEVFSVFNDLRNELICRRDTCFFGYKVNQEMKNLDKSESSKLTKEGVEIYNRMLIYLEKWFDFTETSFFYRCKSFNLEKNITLEEVYELATFFGVELDGDKLFSEIRILNEVRPSLIGTKCLEKWIHFFKFNKSSPLLFNLCKYIFAVPTNNCYVERIFSVMGNIWTNERNRLQTEMVKSELFIHFNFQMSCEDFYNSIRKKTETNKKIIEAAKSSKKYKFL